MIGDLIDATLALEPNHPIRVTRNLRVIDWRQELNEPLPIPCRQINTGVLHHTPSGLERRRLRDI
jgi:hypothetical protein